MSQTVLSGFKELVDEWRCKRDGKDCSWNVIVTAVEARGLSGMGNHGLNDCKLRVTISTDPDEAFTSKVHNKTSNPFFNHVFKLSFSGQPTAFLLSIVQVEVLHVRGTLFPDKLIGLLRIGTLDVFQMQDHKLPLQWFPIVDPSSEEPSVPRGYLRMNIIVNSLDEAGAVQSDVPPEERALTDLLIIPRIHPCATSTGIYNILFRIYQAHDLKRMDIAWGADPYVKITCSTGENRTDTRSGTLNPVWNQQLQLPVYEPLFRELITVEVWHDGSGEIIAKLLFTWKDIISNEKHFNQVRWYDMYELPKEFIAKRIMKHRYVKMVADQVGISGIGPRGVFQAASEYCGRILLSISIEDREGNGKSPSLAQTDLKPKDCKFFQDVPQKAFFRFQIFFAQGIPVPSRFDTMVQVELCIGKERAVSKAVYPNKNGISEWYQSIELEIDFLYDDVKWPWSCNGASNHYDAGLIPSGLIDEGMPDVWIRVYQCNKIAYSVSEITNDFTRSLIGFTRCSVRNLLNLGPPRAGRDGDTYPEMESVHGKFNTEADNSVNERKIDRRNLILNKTGSSQPAFFLKDAEALPPWFNPNHIKHNPNLKYSLRSPGWPAPRGEEDPYSADRAEYPQYNDGRNNQDNMDPYIGVQCFDLEKDGTCALGENDFPGRIWLSCKCYLPSRENCRGAVKGPPILSPFTKYNAVDLPRPELLADCRQVFSLRVHVYQARDLQGINKVGLANAMVEVSFMGKSAKTHVVRGSNSPTWDITLQGGALDSIELSCLGWPGRLYDHDDDSQPEPCKYDVNADPGDQYEEEIWKRNQSMFFFVPWIEIRIIDEGELLGRCFINPETCRHTMQDPVWYEIFKGNPEQDEGKVLLSAQIIHKADPLLNKPVYDLCPIRTEEVTDEDFSWDRDRVGLHIPEDKSKTKLVTMRDCRIQVQILGIRDFCQDLALVSPSIAVFVQTTDQWDADKGFSCLFTQAKEGNEDVYDQNFMEQLELKVLLPDDIEYTPALEFVLIDERSILGFAKRREIIAWGSVPLKEFHPQGTQKIEIEQEEEDDDAAALKRQEAKELKKSFYKILEDLEGRQTISLPDSKLLKRAYNDKEDEEKVKEAVRLCVQSPSEISFVEQTEKHLLGDIRPGASSKRKGLNSMNNETIEEGDAKHDEEEGEKEAGDEGADPQIINSDVNAVAESHAETNEQEGNLAGPSSIHLQDSHMASINPRPEIEEADAGPAIELADNPNQAVQAAEKGEEGEAPAHHEDADGGEGSHLPDQNQDEAGSEGGANRISPEDDEDADRQEEIDTPDGKPNSEWLIFRKNRLYNMPLEETEEEGWRKKLLDSFTEVGLFRGQIEDYKRKESKKLGLIKCKIKIFRKEDANLQGKSKRSLFTKDATFYETLPSDPSVEKALELARPYRMCNIYEMYPDAVVDIRLYCLKAVQVTPGGLNRTSFKDGSPYWYHYLECRLGSLKKESDVDNKLNPSFFHMFEMKGVPLPGPSQLIVELKDGELSEGRIVKNALIGKTVIDLEDRWFCPEWRHLLHKPREVRDLVNEKRQPGISQGKLIVVLDILDENKVEDNPPMDIKVMGKTLPMEMRVIIWDTKDTAAKDGYTSDVYVSGEMLELGEPKVTDVHYGVKLRALGMFNYRLKWRCKFPLDGVEYLFRIGVWDDNLLTAHQCIAEGVLPLRPLFQECFEKNQGKTSPDEMEIVSLLPVDDAVGGKGGYQVGEDGVKYPYRWYTLLHPSVGFNPQRNAQAKLKITIQVLPRAKARANPAGSKRNAPALLGEPNRPPQPANPILEPEKCRAYIAYSCMECLARYRPFCICCVCFLIVITVVAFVVGLKLAVA